MASKSSNSRTVKVGLMTFVDASGVAGRTAALGETVEVHADDLERFDRLNGPGERVEVGEPIEDVSDDAPRSGQRDDESAGQSDQPEQSASNRRRG